MGTKLTLPRDRVQRLFASLALAVTLLALSLVLMDELAQAQAPDGAVTTTDQNHNSAPSQRGVPYTITMWTSPTGLIYANSLNGVYYYGEVVDQYGDWVPPGTPVSMTYDLRAWNWPGGYYTDTKPTDEEGQIWGGWIHVESPGIVTFTAWANVTATAFVTAEFIYNPAAAITITAAPAQIEMGGETAVVTATLAGLHGGFASDGTEVAFDTSLGSIDLAGSTVAGLVTTTLTSGEIFGTATITATVDDLQATTTVRILAHEIYYFPLVFHN